MNIKHHLALPYTPQANPGGGANKTVKTMIGKFCGQDQRKWGERISELNFAFNTARQEPTGFKPALSNFGREMEVSQPILSELPSESRTERVREESNPQSVQQHC